TLPSGVMPAKSRTGSYAMLWIAGAVTSPFECTSTVLPSGSALATALTPIAPPPPGRFSTMMGCPDFAATCSNTVRGRVSVALPGAKGPTTVTRLFGQATPCSTCPNAQTTANAQIEPAIPTPSARHARDIFRVLLSSDGAVSAERTNLPRKDDELRG